MTGLNKTERRVLAAVKWETERVIEDAQRDRDAFGWSEQITGAALGLKSIVRAYNILTVRKIGESRIYDALQGLVAKGLVVKTTTTGMGGGFTDYRLKEQRPTEVQSTS